MGPESIVLILVFGAVALVRIAKEVNRRGAIEAGVSEQQHQQSVLGRPIVLNVELKEEENGSDGDLAQTARLTASVYDVLPPWLTLYGGPQLRERRNWWLSAIAFGPTADTIPSDLAVHADQGTFTITTDPFIGFQWEVTKTTKKVNEYVTLLLTAYSERGPDEIRQAILSHADEAIEDRANRQALDAFDYACRYLGDDLDVQSLCASALTSPNIEARTIAALYATDTTGREILRQVVLTDPPTVSSPVRQRALRTLIRRRDVDTVLEVDGDWPARLQIELLDTWAKAKAPQSEAKILPFLRHKDEQVVEAAVDALARVGGKNAVQPLSELRRTHPRSESLSIGINVAIELIKDRLLAQPGAVSLADDRDKGQLSPVEGGQITIIPSDQEEG